MFKKSDFLNCKEPAPGGIEKMTDIFPQLRKIFIPKNENKVEKLGQPSISILKCWNSQCRMLEVLGSVIILFYIADPE